MCAKVENGVTKSCQFFSRKNRGKTQFWPEIFLFFEQDRLLFARVEIGVTDFPTKTPEKVEKNGSEIFFKWACASRFQWGIFIFLAAEKLTLGGANNFKTG